METNIIKAEIEKTIDAIIGEFQNYDGSVESGIEIIQVNQDHINKLRVLFAKGQVDLDSNYNQKMEYILEKQGQIYKALEVEKEDILKNMKQIHKKNSVVNNYMPQNKDSIFVDKDT